MNENRRDKINYYLDIAETVLKRSTCLKRRWGSVIVKHNSIMATGYNGSPRGMTSCIDTGICNRMNAVRGTDYANCPAIHSECNAILHAGRENTLGSTLYLVGLEYKENDWKYTENPNSCTTCRRLIINAGIEKVYIRIDSENYKVVDVQKDWASDIKNIIGGY